MLSVVMMLPIAMTSSKFDFFQVAHVYGCIY